MSGQKLKIKTKKKRPIIIDSSPTLTFTPLDKKPKKNNKTKKTKRKRLFVIYTTSSLPINEKNGFSFEENIITPNKTDLKITPLNKEMEQNTNNILPSGRLNEPFIELMEQLAVKKFQSRYQKSWHFS